MGRSWAPFPLTQLVSYGTLFYAFALLIEPMKRELGWSRPQTHGRLSRLRSSLSALFAVPVGRFDRSGYGRAVMTGGSVLAAILLALWSHGRELSRRSSLLWIVFGFTMSAVLYEPGFAVLHAAGLVL